MAELISTDLGRYLLLLTLYLFDLKFGQVYRELKACSIRKLILTFRFILNYVSGSSIFIYFLLLLAISIIAIPHST